MSVPEIERIVQRRERVQVAFQSLMPRRVQKILLVASLYDAFTFEEDGQLGELLLAEYTALNLSFTPQVTRTASMKEALERLQKDPFDLVISMPRVGEENLKAFAHAVQETRPGIPLVVLAYNTRELQLVMETRPEGVSYVFVWQGDQRLFTAITKIVEDSWNIENDVAVAGVQAIILVEDSVRFYSSYLPMLYTELVKQTQGLMSDSVNRMQKLLRMRARPKILLATSYEEGMALFERFRGNVLGVVSDLSFPRAGAQDPEAGLALAAALRTSDPDLPVLIQSTDASFRERAAAAGACFIHKESPLLLAEVRAFMSDHMGFGAFVFRYPDGTEVGRARTIKEMIHAIRKLPLASILYHARNNHFSTWLMARTEFALARAIRPRNVEDFESQDAVRSFLLQAFRSQDSRTREGQVAEFSRETGVDPASMFVRIGDGSLGGKGRGLAFMNSLISRYRIEDHVPGVQLYVPPTAVLATGVFDAFMERSRLASFAFQESSDTRIAEAFLNAPFPESAAADVLAFLREVDFPLAVRSSSLLEDANTQPFAGVYATHMIPNNHPDIEVRLRDLLRAIRLVYASSYFADAKAYIESTPSRLEEEKMAVVIQQVVGRRHGDLYYPDLAGTARSRDFYPVQGMRPEDGVACAALGLGATVAGGGRCVRFCPRWPRNVVMLSSVESTLEYAQRDFFALEMTRSLSLGRAADPSLNIVKADLSVAEAHGTLDPVGSVYSRENEAIYDGLSRPGVRLVTLAGVLKADVFPLPESLNFVLDLGAAAFSSPVEVEYAVTLSEVPGRPHRFGFLQIRPLGAGLAMQEVDLSSVSREDAVCISSHALGHGSIHGIRHLVYVRPDAFDRSRTEEVAREVGHVNALLRQKEERYVLIGPGRWGTADRWLGIPVSWSQVSQAACFVETSLKDLHVEPSQGTHFFQNITSLGIGYFTLRHGDERGFVDIDWLERQPAEYESPLVRLVVFDKEMDILVDSRSGAGVITRPGAQVVRP